LLTSRRAAAHAHTGPGPSEGGGSIWTIVGPTGFVVALLVLATVYSGAFAVQEWAPPTLFVLVVLLTIAVRGGAIAVGDRWVLAMLGAVWALAGWEALSATWGVSGAAALEGAGRQALYAGVMTLPFVAVVDRRSLRVAAEGITVGIACIAVYTLARMLVDGPAIFLAGRLNDPIGYRNATALLFAIAYWPLISSAATRSRPRAVRAVSFGLAELMLGLAFLTQSRGLLLGLACGAAVALALGPDRLLRAWLALLSCALLAAVASPLLTPYDAFIHHNEVVTSGEIATAARVLLALALAAGAIMLLIAVFDAGLRAAHPAMARVRRLAAAGLVGLAIVGVAGVVAASHGNPIHEAHVKWNEFSDLQATNTGSTRFSSAGGQRYDLWRVALDEFRSAPVGGVGMGSYQFDYYRLRHTNRNLDDPHGLIFQVMGELGTVGLLLLVVFLVSAGGAIATNWRGAPLDTRRVAGGLAAAGATFVGQSLVDWMWRIPGLTALGLLCIAVSAAMLVRSHEPEGAAARARRRWPVWVRVPSSAVLVGAIWLVLTLYLATVEIDRANHVRGVDPVTQLLDARTAAELEPSAVEPHYIEASALESVGDRAAALAQLQAAARLEPNNFVPIGLLGDFEARGHQWALARRYYRAALALDPLDVGLQQLAANGGRPAGR
jgi:hypothetical protein